MSDKIDNILGSSSQKNTRKEPKMITFVITKTFENLRLENYRSNINETFIY